MAPEHIVKSFEQELEQLTRLITQMGGYAEAQIEMAVTAVERRDVDLAARVVRNDRQLDQYERDIDNAAVRLLALRQPVASDLREIVGSLKIASDLERIGDYAANIAKRAITIAQMPIVQPVGGISRTGHLVQEILKDVLDAYSERDIAKAVEAWHRDEDIDELYTALFREVLTYMMEDPRNITACTHVLFMAKNLERVGDHATNIAETIHFVVLGEPLAESRPKSDRSSYENLAPDEAGDPAED